MPAKKHIITLSAQERAELEKISQSNRRSVREKTRARLLLGSDTTVPREEGGSLSDTELALRFTELALRFKVNVLTVSNVRRRAHERGVVVSVVRNEQKKRKARKLDGVGQAHLIAVTCSAPPEGAARWSLNLIRNRLIELEIVESIGLETLPKGHPAPRSKKRTEALAQADVVYPAPTGCSFCLCHGRCIGSLRSSL